MKIINTFLDTTPRQWLQAFPRLQWRLPRRAFALCLVASVGAHVFAFGYFAFGAKPASGPAGEVMAVEFRERAARQITDEAESVYDDSSTIVVARKKTQTVHC